MSFRNFKNFSQETWKDVLEVGVPKKQATVAAHYFDDYWWHIQNTDWLLGGVEVQKVMGIDHITFCHFFCGTSAKKKDKSWLQHAAMKRGGHRPAAPTLTMDSYGFSFAQLHHTSVGFWKKLSNERLCTVVNQKKLIRDLKYLMEQAMNIQIVTLLISKSWVFPAMSLLKPSNSFRTGGIGKPAKL